VPRTIDLRLFATLAKHMPDNASRFPISDGMTVDGLIEQLTISPADAKLIFINGVRATLESRLNGGDRVGIFPPVGGG
jgi:molybdopterin converting factor small subunit